MKVPKTASTRFVLPRGVAGSEPANADEGTLSYDPAGEVVRVKTASGWQEVGSGGGGGAPSGSAGGDLGGTYPNPSVVRAEGLKSTTTTVSVSGAAAPTTGQALVATSSTAASWQTLSTSPTGSAGGDLGGTYPNPSVAKLTTTTGPTSLTIGAVADGQALIRSGSSVIGATLGALYNLRDPVWDPPTTGSPDDDEFTTDTFASGAWTMNFTRAGAIDITQDIASGTYRSTCISGTLYVQVRRNEQLAAFKTFSGALTTDQLWYCGIGLPTESGTGLVNNPQFTMGFYKNLAGGLDNNNRAGVRTASAADRLENFAVTGGGIVFLTSGGTWPVGQFQTHGLGAFVRHGTTGAFNFAGFGFGRNGAYNTLQGGQSVQYNASTDKIALLMLANSTNTPTTKNFVMFALHFVRRVAAGSGIWIARD